MSEFDRFDRSKVKLGLIESRRSLLNIDDIVIHPDYTNQRQVSSDVDKIARRMYNIANYRGCGELDNEVILCMGAHAIKNGAQLLINELLTTGMITHVASNVATAIHDFEFAVFGKSTEAVRNGLTNGNFGTWFETCAFFDRITRIDPDDGLGETIGNELLRMSPHWLKYSVVAKCAELGIPYTIHPCFGQDIIWTGPYVRGELLGRKAEIDFEIFVDAVSKLSCGAYLSVGSAIMSPMIFEKALSMVRNVAHQNGKRVSNFIIAVNDIVPISSKWGNGSEPNREDPEYYARFLKTFNRAGEEVIYIQKDNREFLGELGHSIHTRYLRSK